MCRGLVVFVGGLRDIGIGAVRFSRIARDWIKIGANDQI